MSNVFNRNSADWGRLEHIRYRERRLIDVYRAKYGSAATIPSSRQYWTLCGNHALDGIPLEHAELPALLESGLLTQSQFWGVDNSHDIIERAKVAYPNAHWICDEFTLAIRTAFNTGQFNPAIIHYDSMSSARAALAALSRIMVYVELGNASDCMVVANIVREHWIRKSNDTAKQIEEDLINNTTKHKERWELVFEQDAEAAGYEFRSKRSTMLAFTMFYQNQRNCE